MSDVVLGHAVHPLDVDSRFGCRLFGVTAAGIACVAALLAGWAPIGFSIATVFLFAGPHNWYEIRYFLSRMPSRWGRRRAFYTIAIVGCLALTAMFALNGWLGETMHLTNAGWAALSSAWSTSLILWLGVLLQLRAAESKNGWGDWIWPVAFLAIGIAWLVPTMWAIGLVYLHPLIALLFLQRELRRRRPSWLPTYYLVLCLVPILLAVLWIRLATSENLPGVDGLTDRIIHHAGASYFSGVSSHLLVATHVFLENLHYGVWLVAIPLLTFGRVPWRVAATPVAKKSASWRWVVRGVIFGGGAIVLLLWVGFAANYPLTRDIYFTLAIFHVCAEFTFLIGTV
ncbi:MAG: hypothetical protein ACI9G1_004501 [Pirellulaceae bacterium]|jgi:hypothetical protein